MIDFAKLISNSTKTVLATAAAVTALLHAPNVQAAGMYKGKLETLICDIKQPLYAPIAGSEIDESNYQNIINGLAWNMGCGGIRVYIDPGIARSPNYPATYKHVIQYARSLGLQIYANPMNTGTFGMDRDTYAQWIVRYANYYHPDFLAPFNESGWGGADLVYIANYVRAHLTYWPEAFIGPDQQKVQSAISMINSTAGLVQSFDIVGAHNANADSTATAGNWKKLSSMAGAPVWNTENPRPFSAQNGAGTEIGVRAALMSPVTGIVLYMSYPCDIDANGNLTAKGNGIMQGIMQQPWDANPNPTPTNRGICGM